MFKVHGQKTTEKKAGLFTEYRRPVRPATYTPLGSNAVKLSPRATGGTVATVVLYDPEDLVKLTQLTKITLKEAKSKIKKLTVA